MCRFFGFIAAAAIAACSSTDSAPDTGPVAGSSGSGGSGSIAGGAGGAGGSAGSVTGGSGGQIPQGGSGGQAAAGSGGVAGAAGASGAAGSPGTAGSAGGAGGASGAGGGAGSGGSSGAGGGVADGGADVVDAKADAPGAPDAARDQNAADGGQATGVKGRLFVGYQGWFFATGDGSVRNMWTHWSKSGMPTPGNVNFEVFPDIREYTKLYATGLSDFPNGTQARLFSSYNPETVNKHFEWMRDYGIAGAALQRFGADSKDTAWKEGRDKVAVNVRDAAETFGRSFYVMYDISGGGTGWVDAVKTDYIATIVGSMRLTASPAYAKENGKPVVCIWGIGFTDRPGTTDEALSLIQWFKGQGVYLIGGVPTRWRTSTDDSKPGFLDVYKSFDMISPWLVGRFGNTAGVDSFKTSVWQPDVDFCAQNGIAYQPVMFPGFAWTNLKGLDATKRNEIPRMHGDFLWRQAYQWKSLGVSTAYVAMFDEYDEGTAIAKAAENSTMIPTNQYFLPLDADGVAVSADFYLRLVGDVGRMLGGEIAATAAHPTAHAK